MTVPASLRSSDVHNATILRLIPQRDCVFTAGQDYVILNMTTSVYSETLGLPYAEAWFYVYHVTDYDYVHNVTRLRRGVDSKERKSDDHKQERMNVWRGTQSLD